MIRFPYNLRYFYSLLYVVFGKLTKAFRCASIHFSWGRRTDGRTDGWTSGRRDKYFLKFIWYWIIFTFSYSPYLSLIQCDHARSFKCLSFKYASAQFIPIRYQIFRFHLLLTQPFTNSISVKSFGQLSISIQFLWTLTH